MTTGRIARATAAVFAGRTTAQALLVGATVVLATRVGPGVFGSYAFIAAVVLVANVVTTFGTDMLLVREVAAGRSTIGPASCLAVQMLLTIPVLVLLIAGAPLMSAGGGVTADALRIASIALIPAAVFSVATAVLRGAGRAGRYALVGVAVAAAQAAAITVFVGPRTGLNTLAWIIVVTNTIGAVVGLAATVGSVPRTVWARRPTPRTVRATFGAAAPIGWLAWAGSIYDRAAIIVVGLVAGPAPAGWLAAGTRIVEASKSGHVALATVLYPVHAATARTSPPDGPSTSGDAGLRSVRRRSVAAAGLIAVCLGVAGPSVVSRLLGPAFQPAAAGLVILALSIVPAVAAGHLTIEALADGREDQVGRALTSSLVILVVLLAVLVPSIGWIGGAWAVAVAEAVRAALLLAATRRSGRPVVGLAPARSSIAEGSRT